MNIYVVRASIYCPLFRCIQNLLDFQFGIIFVKYLQYIIETVHREPLSATESVAKVKSFFESTRKKAPNFSK